MSALPRELVDALIRLLGVDHVVTSPAARATYECDGYTLERAIPDLIIHPGSPEQVAEALALLARYGVPLVPRGAGTSLAGGCLAPPGAVVVSLARLHQIEAVEAEHQAARVQAGVINLSITRAAAAHGLGFAPDPSSQSVCTVGGNIANNSGGPHTLKVGVTVNHVLAVDWVTPDGQRRWIGSPVPMRGGPDVTGLMVGSEGTFGMAVRAWVRLTPLPAAWRTLLASFDSVVAAGRAVSAIVSSGIVPAAVEMMDATVLLALERAFGMSFPQDAAAVLLLEVDGVEDGIDDEAAIMEQCCRDAGAVSVAQATDPVERNRLWSARKKAFGALGGLAPNYCTQDGVVPRSRLPEMLERIRVIQERHQVRIANVFHAGDGNLHPIIMYDGANADDVRRVLAASEEILTTCLELGGSLTGEHGIGIEKRELMTKAFDADTLAVMARVRAVFDPERRCNANKMFPSGAGCSDSPQLQRTRPGAGVPQ